MWTVIESNAAHEGRLPGNDIFSSAARELWHGDGKASKSGDIVRDAYWTRHPPRQMRSQKSQHHERHSHRHRARNKRAVLQTARHMSAAGNECHVYRVGFVATMASISKDHARRLEKSPYGQEFTRADGTAWRVSGISLPLSSIWPWLLMREAKSAEPHGFRHWQGGGFSR